MYDRNDPDFLDEMEQESRKDKTPEEMSDKELGERFEIMLDDLSDNSILKLLDLKNMIKDCLVLEDIKKLMIKRFSLGDKEDALNDFRSGKYE